MQHYTREEYYNYEESCYTESYYKRVIIRERARPRGTERSGVPKWSGSK